ncbi:MAG: YHYH protein [Deltaproteobacteria bacterium]|nr:YHYH protein [Deltaproteobacteria bacterium]
MMLSTKQRAWIGGAASTLSAMLAAFACGGSATEGGGGADAGATPEDAAQAEASANLDGGGGDGGTVPREDRCTTITRSIDEAGFGAKVKVTCDGGVASIASDTYPAHVKMNGITGTNDQVPVPAPGYVSPIALAPVKAATPTSIDAALGVAVNGVPIYDYTSQGTNDLSSYDPKFDTKLTGELDLCNGHSGRGDDYHYHAAPTCMVDAMKNKGPAAILGWGFDGYPIYGNTNPDGTAIAPGDLDVCNAKPDAEFGYRYHTSDQHPYILQCLVGVVDTATAPRVPPLQKLGGGGKPPGSKPPGGVTDLALVEAPDGTRTMTYDHAGQTYSFVYRPSTTAGCWDFEEKSYTTGGVLVASTYCRAPR